jgi:hypothetical protein
VSGTDAPAPVTVVAAADTPEGGVEARRVDGPDATIVLCGTDASALGALAAGLRARTAVFVGDLAGERDRRALDELVGEVFGRD